MSSDLNDSRFDNLLKEKKIYASQDILFSNHPDFKSLLRDFNDEEKKDIINLIKYEEELIRNTTPTHDDFIKLKFNKDITLNRIKNLFFKLRLKYQIQENDRIILIKRSELDKTAPVFQEKILKFQA